MSARITALPVRPAHNRIQSQPITQLAQGASVTFGKSNRVAIFITLCSQAGAGQVSCILLDDKKNPIMAITASSVVPETRVIETRDLITIKNPTSQESSDFGLATGTCKVFVFETFPDE